LAFTRFPDKTNGRCLENLLYREYGDSMLPWKDFEVHKKELYTSSFTLLYSIKPPSDIGGVDILVSFSRLLRHQRGWWGIYSYLDPHGSERNGHQSHVLFCTRAVEDRSQYYLKYTRFSYHICLFAVYSHLSNFSAILQLSLLRRKNSNFYV
jgi:hypothetical protein